MASYSERLTAPVIIEHLKSKLQRHFETAWPAERKGHAFRSYLCRSCRSALRNLGYTSPRGSARRGEQEHPYPPRSDARSIELAAFQGCAMCAVMHFLMPFVTHALHVSYRVIEGDDDDSMWKSFWASQATKTTLECHFGDAFGSTARFVDSMTVITVRLRLEQHAQVSTIYPTLTASPIRHSTLSTQCMKTMTHWIRDCARGHPFCNAEKKGQRPGRLINVSNNPALRVVSGSQSEEAYTALSYTWGGSSSLLATQSNIGALYEGFSVYSLAMLMQDAVLLTQSLGFSYLWVDCLCIIQDSEDDWNSQASMMGDIYANAAVTLSPVAASSVSDSILAPRDTFNGGNALTVEIDTTFNSGGLTVGLGTLGWTKSTMYPSQQRGWCFQERLLSRRTIHFTKEQVLFECRTHSISEDRQPAPEKLGYQSTIDGEDWKDLLFGATPRGQHSHGHYKMKVPILHQAWQALVCSYSSKKFTFSTDRLPAIAGLAKTFEKVMDDTYIAGLWIDNLLEGLIWYAYHSSDEGAGQGQSQASALVANHANYTPSWSWAAAPGRIGFFTRKETAGDGLLPHTGMSGALAEIVGVDLDAYNNDDRFSAIRRADLTIKSWLFLYKDKIPEARDWWQWDFDAPGMTIEMHMREHGCVEIIQIGVEDSMDLYYNITYHPIGLVLTPVDGRDGCYRRVGLVTRYEHLFPEYEGLQKRTITII